MTNEPRNGALLWFNPQKGFGMIRPADSHEDDVFCPALAMEGNPENYIEGTAVSYYVEQQLIGMVATGVWRSDENI